MNYAKQADQLREERLKQEANEKQAKDEKDRIAAEEAKRLREIEDVRNKELLELFKQFDKHGISNGAEKLEAGLTPTVNNIQYVCLKLGSSTLSLIHSWEELGAVLLATRYFAEEQEYLLLRYNRRNQRSPQTVGRYKSVEDLMESVVEEVAKL